ncbi:XRE family transcriptional regulator [Herbiconiux sp. P16]|uniref:XRE family transcriptional regulator n=1 Tax=Herbiconiux wuyangfengii TaxID=3342794 RepID=UPI0035B6CD01
MEKISRPSGRLSGVSALFDGSRLTLARKLVGLKKTQVAELVGMTPASVSAWENNSTKPSSSTVARLSLVLEVEPQFFLPISAEIAATVPHFRSLRSTTQTAQEQAAAYGRLVGDIGTLIEKSVEFPEKNLPVIPIDATQPSVDGPENAARQARSFFGLPVGPVAHMVRLAERAGVLVVFSAPRTASIDAFSMEVDGRPIVVLNPEKDDYYRQRFDVAHELGHLIMHSDAEPGGKIAEDQAHRFAAEFLTPAEQIESFLPRTTTDRGWEKLAHLKEHWGVSMQALLFRSRALGVMSDVSYRNAMIRVSANGWRRAEPGAVVAVEMTSLIPRAVEVLEGAGVSAADIVRGPGLPLSVFETIAARGPQNANSGIPSPVLSSLGAPFQGLASALLGSDKR